MEKLAPLQPTLARWLLPVVALLLAGALLWVAWEPLTTLLSDGGALREWVAGLGAWGPVALIVLGVVQVLVAPLPGYPIVFVSGLLYGGFWGAIYANIGILLAGMLSAWLARRFGRPLVARFVEQTHQQRLERMLANENPWFWFLVLFLPTGDLPYFAAGLSRVSLRHYFLALCAARLPFTFALTHAAAQATTLPPSTLLLIALPILLLGALAYWQQERLHRWFDRFLGHPSPPVAPTPEPPIG